MKQQSIIRYMARFSSPTSSGAAVFASKLELQQWLMSEEFITADFKPLKSVNCAKIERTGNHSVVLHRWDYGMADNFRI